MESIKLFIIDPDVQFVDLARRFMQNFPDVEVIGTEHNGQDGLRCIRNMHPDAVLFELALPGLDGIALLRGVNELANPPAMICCTRFYSDVSLEALRTFGASYILFKPVELNAIHPAVVSCTQLHRKMRRMARSLEQADSTGTHSNAHIRNYIVSLGIPSKLIGCSYLTEAIRLAKMDLTLTRNLSKGLYLEISRNMNSTPTRIERCIRNAISVAYQNGRLEGKMISCPSNKEFINYVLRTIDL